MSAAAAASSFKIEVTRKVECDRKSKNGDTLRMHYTGTLLDGTKFDSSLDRNQAFEFTIGSGQVIQGWEQGLLDMCPGEERTLTIPPEMAYGNRRIGPIPAGSTLKFDVKLVEIKGYKHTDKEL
ncbi:FK506-binding protein 2 [Escovopsis weberi]|uniref:peptidylprolyl isomerase n=1 Tax=Escovopsis weberi TaxID=150374 RepID=A0A0M9VXN3_ESCWE|nr:FK506-binding protein 2 [Escovopsis weberi]